MRILVDTHIALWALYEPERLSSKALKILQDGENEFFCSVISAWEIFIKRSLHADAGLIDGDKFISDCELAGFETLPLFTRHVRTLKTLSLVEGAPRHKDPYDRMLLAQAKADGMKLLTHDAKLSFYGEACVQLV